MVKSGDKVPVTKPSVKPTRRSLPSREVRMGVLRRSTEACFPRYAAKLRKYEEEQARNKDGS